MKTFAVPTCPGLGWYLLGSLRSRRLVAWSTAALLLALSSCGGRNIDKLFIHSFIPSSAMIVDRPSRVQVDQHSQSSAIQGRVVHMSSEPVEKSHTRTIHFINNACL